MMDTEKIFYNAVTIALDGNPSSVRALRKKCGDLFSPWESAYQILRNDGHSPPDPETEWEKVDAAGIRLILSGDHDFPPLLREIQTAPLGIYIRGELPESDGLALVGTRRATPEGKVIAKKFARELARVGLFISSGLALGIDAAGHEGCLDGGGRTIAVLAGGLNDIYPSQNERLGKRILESGGAIISEYPLGSPPYPDRFLERNRIVSGLAKGALIVECPTNSGSLATARFALEQNRDVFVIPGPISHPNFFGSHSLIRQGAELVTKPEDILEAYEITQDAKAMREEVAASPEERQVLLALRSIGGVADVDKIVAVAKLEPRVANRAITFLIVKQLIRETDMGYIIE